MAIKGHNVRLLADDFWEQHPPRRLLFIKPSALGDVVQALPLARAAKERWPDVTIGWVIAAGLRRVVQLSPWIDEIYEFHRGAGLWSFLKLCRELRSRDFDSVIDLQGLLRTGVMTLSTGSANRIGLQTSREGSSWAYHAMVDQTSRQIPAHARYWKMAEAWGVSTRYTTPSIVVPQSDQQLVESWLESLPRPLIGIQPGTRWVTKSWPVESFAQVAMELAEQTQGSLIILGAPDETQLTGKCSELIGSVNPQVKMIDLGGKSSLPQLASLLSRLNVLVCNDSGPMHLAAEMQTPVTAVFTCTDPVQSGPPGSIHQLISTKLPCRAGYHKHCPMTGDNHLACFRDVTVQQVASAAMKILSSH